MSTERTPRVYQTLGIRHILEHPRCALHAGTGTGKTGTTLLAADILQLQGELGKALLLGPLRVARDVWTDEAPRWKETRGLRIARVIGNEAARRAALRQAADIYVTNYEQVPWLLDRLKHDWPFDTIIADEATRLKGFRGSIQTSSTGKRFLRIDTGKRTGALARVAHGKTRRFVELTGTPAPNGLKDLWAQLWFLDGGERLGRTYSAFLERWFTLGRDGYTLQELPHALDEISGLISDICLPIRAADYFDLPPVVENDLQVTLPEKAMRQYREMEKRSFLEIADVGVEAFGAASKTLKCLQLANGAIYLDEKAETWAEAHTAKIEALESIIEEASGAPVIVAYKFRSDLERLLKRFKGSVDLSTTEGLRRFKTGSVTVGIGHPQSIGHGIDGIHHVCNIIAFFGLDYDLECREQIIERIGPTRQKQAGFDRPTFVHNIVASGTYDEMALQRVRTKAGIQQLLLEYTKRRRGLQK